MVVSGLIVLAPGKFASDQAYPSTSQIRASNLGVTVSEHTQLNGAVIGSSATADNNRLDTGTLGFSDIRNQADYKVEHQSVGFSTGGNVVAALANGAAPSLAEVIGHDPGLT